MADLLDNPAVFDVFPGSGMMHRHIWHQYPYQANPLPLEDIKSIEANLVDVDTYSNPWPVIERLLPLCAADPLGIVATDAALASLKFGGRVPIWAIELCGCQQTKRSKLWLIHHYEAACLKHMEHIAATVGRKVASAQIVRGGHARQMGYWGFLIGRV